MTDARILDRGYRKYDGERSGVPGAVKSVAWHTTRSILGLGRAGRHKVFPIIVGIVAFVPALVFMAVAVLFGEIGDEVRPDYWEFFGFSLTAALLFTAFVAPEAVVRDRRLEDRDHLLRIAGEAARDETATELHRERAHIHRRKVVDDARLQLRALVRGRGELALGQTVDAVVLDDVDHREVAADQVHELPQPDRRRVAIAGDADPDEVVIRENRARGDRRHAAMHRVETVGARDEIRRGL